MDKIIVSPMPYMSVMPTLLVGANVKGKPNYMVAAWATVASMGLDDGLGHGNSVPDQGSNAKRSAMMKPGSGYFNAP